MTLDQEIQARRAEIRSDGYAMSIGEIISLYRDNELDIHPEFQRFYRWSDDQKSRLIESILLGIPLPSIFVSQREDGVWDVIDGLQRLSTILQLVGHLKNDSGDIVKPLILRKTKYLPSLEGKQWNNDNPSKTIGTANQLLIRRSKIDVKIILRESSESSKYELFQRLNTGGSQLSDQELRNAILTMVNPDAFRWIEHLAKDENFQSCIALPDGMLSQRYDMELVIRFIVFRNLEDNQLRAIGDIGEFLTDKIVELAQSEQFNRMASNENTAFEKTFSCLAQSFSDRSFRKYDSGKGRHSGGFSISAFEPIALGVGHNFERFTSASDLCQIKQISKDLWSNPDFLSHSGMGVNASTRIRYNIPLGKKLFAI